MSEVFKFKHFNVAQDKCAMKVGTDGVLLGAWASINDTAYNALDIGTGSGVIALQLAQKTTLEEIDGLEIDPDAFEQAVENFEQSDWGDRLFCYHASLQEFVAEIDVPYDVIISNPPYYTSTYKKGVIDKQRALARHVESLPYDVLLSAVSKLLSEKGIAAFIIPYKSEVNFLTLAEKMNLFPQKITRVRGNESAEIKRSLLQLSFNKQAPVIDELIIEIERHQYTSAYIELVKDYYLKM